MHARKTSHALHLFAATDPAAANRIETGKKKRFGSGAPDLLQSNDLSAESITGCGMGTIKTQRKVS